jgi:hypothetical protein
MYLLPPVGNISTNVGGSLSTIHGKAVNAYHPFVAQVNISSEEILEFITAPSSVVF